MKSCKPYFKTINVSFSFTEQQQQKLKKKKRKKKPQKDCNFNPLPTKVFLATFLPGGGHYEPLWKFVMKHPTFMKVVPNLTLNDPVFSTVHIRRLFFFSNLECKILNFSQGSRAYRHLCQFSAKMANSHSNWTQFTPKKEFFWIPQPMALFSTKSYIKFPCFCSPVGTSLLSYSKPPPPPPTKIILMSIIVYLCCWANSHLLFGPRW